MLLERVLRVVQHQVLERLVDVVRLGEAKTPLGGVNYAVIYRAVAPIDKKEKVYYNNLIIQIIIKTIIAMFRAESLKHIIKLIIIYCYIMLYYIEQ